MNAQTISPDTRATVIARVAYMGAKGRFYGSTLHLDFLGRNWPTTDDKLDLGAHVAAILEPYGYGVEKVIAKNYTLSRPIVNTHPSAFDLTESEWNKQRRTV